MLNRSYKKQLQHGKTKTNKFEGGVYLLKIAVAWGHEAAGVYYELSANDERCVV